MGLGLRVRNYVVVVALALAAGTAWAQPSEPQAIVERFQEHLLSVMQGAQSMTVRERYKRLLPAIDEAFSVPFLVATATGAHWKNASPEAKARLTDAFKRKNVSTVATLFDGYSGQKFEVLGEKPAPQNTRLVMTRIVDPDGSSVHLDYRVLEVDGRWWIIDVVVDQGISEMSVRRSEFRNILKNEGIEGLTAILDAKADELLAQ